MIRPTFGPYSQAYDYDQWGNMTVRYGWGGWDAGYVNWAPSYTNNRLATNPATGAAMQYDAAGNLSNDGYQSYSYDSTGQQTYASGTALTQNYDGDGLRVKKNDNGAQIYYLRSSVLGGQVVAEIIWASVSWQWSRGYVYLGSQLLAVQQAGVYWMHEDPVTKSKRVTNSAGTIVSTIELDPWGADTNRSSNAAFQPKKFTSYERDGNGSDEAMFRRYNRWHSRFDQPDPYDGSYDLSDPQSFNRYSYTQNDPVNFVDPSGLRMTLICWFRPDGEGGSTYTCAFGDVPDPREPTGDPSRGGGGGRRIPQNPAPQQKNCNLPTFDGLSAAQQGLLNSVPGGNGAGFFNGLSQAQQASFLNITGALAAASVSVSGLGLSRVEQDRLFFALGTTGTPTTGFQASVQAGIDAHRFARENPKASEHPGMSDFGARQNRTTNALQVGIGSAGGFADIDRGNPRKFPFGTAIHLGELITPGKTDPFAVGRALGSKVTGYTCK